MMMEPSRDAFNSILKLDLPSNRPFNLMINAGATEVVSLLAPRFTFNEMLEYTRRLCLDNSISLDTEAYCSEACTGNRNRAIGYLLASKDMLHGDVLSCVDMYFQLCFLSVTARSLAGMSLVLSADGVDPKMGERLLDKRVVRTMKTLMFTCDMYDESGEYACRVGIPSKVVWVRRYYGLCRRMYGHWMLWPALDTRGNSIGGIYTMERLSDTLKLHVFDADNDIR